MKNFNQFSIVLVLFIFLYSNSVVAQKKIKSFKGTITYEITYSGKELEPAQKAQMPTIMTAKILGKKSKKILMGPMSQTIILDAESKTGIMMIDAMGNKMHFKLNKEELKKITELKSEYLFKHLEETKEIAGYNCKKVEVTKKDEDSEETTYAIYYSKEIGSKDLNFASEYKEIDGAMLEYQETDSQGIISTYTATNVKKGKIKNIDFLIHSE